MPWTVMPKIRSNDRPGFLGQPLNGPERTAFATSRLRRCGVRTALVATLAVTVALTVGTAPEQAGARAGVTPPQATPKPAVTLSPVVHPRRVAHRAPTTASAQPRTLAHPPVRHQALTPITVHVVEVATAAEGQAAVNRCAGPVEVQYGHWGYPNDIIQHDYCGGAWMAFIRPGTKIHIVGGTEPGLYVANGNRRLVPKNARVSFLAGIGDMALQTCEGDHLALIGLTRI